MAVAIWGWSVVNFTVVPDFDNWSFERKAHGANPAVLAYVADRSREFGEDVRVWLRLAPPPSPVRIIAPAGPMDRNSTPLRKTLPVNWVLGRLGIPRLGIQTMVREGDGEQTLISSLGHIPGTALPGESIGNVGVAGHRDTFFRRLEGIRKNDVLKFETSSGVYTYEVVSTRIVKPESVDVLRPGNSAEMTLVTCYPFRYIGNAPDRFIVKARLLPSTVVAAASPEQTPQVSEVKQTAAPERSPKPAETLDRRTASFSLIKGHTQILAPGVLIGVTDIDADRNRVDAWVSIQANRKTIWLPNQRTGEPIVFHNEWTGEKYQVTITRILDGIVAGYALLPSPSDHVRIKRKGVTRQSASIDNLRAAR